MAFLTGQTWYCGSTKYSAVAQWAASTAYAAGTIVRQLAAPAVGNERVFVNAAAGTSGSTEPSWNLTQGATTTDNTITWYEITGKAAVNGDLVNTTIVPRSSIITPGVVVKNTPSTGIFLCTTTGTSASSEPTFNTTAGATTTDGTVIYTCIGTSFTSYAAPCARLYPIIGTPAFPQTGDTVYVSNNHAETQAAAIAYTSSSAVLNIICVADTATPPATTAKTASITTTGANALAFGSIGYCYGLNFNCGTGSTAANLNLGYNNGSTIFDNCSANLLNTGTTSYIGFGYAASCLLDWKNGAVTFTNASQVINTNYRVRIIGGSIAATGTVPTVAFAAPSAYTYVQNVDLSAITTALVANSYTLGDMYFVDCKLAAGVALTSGTSNNYSATRVRIHNSDSANTNYNYFYYNYAGSVQSETTTVLSGGSTDGTTPLSWKMISTANSSVALPLTSENFDGQWNAVVGTSKTATINITTNTALTNNDMWLEITYPIGSSSPLGGVATSKAALLTAPVTLTTSASSWGGTALTYKYKIAVPFTATAAGPILARIHLAKPSVTAYVDPQVTIA